MSATIAPAESQFFAVSRGHRLGTFRTPEAAAEFLREHGGPGTLYTPETRDQIAGVLEPGMTLGGGHPCWSVTAPLAKTPGASVQVSAVDLGEGLQGDYDPEDPQDMPLLRFDVHVLRDGDAIEVSDGSWCTSAVREDDTPLQIVEALVRACDTAREQIDQRPVEVNGVGEVYAGKFEWLSWLESEYGLQTGLPVCRSYAPDTGAAEALDRQVCTGCFHTKAVHELDVPA